ncbi:MAG: hypothetical protein GX421_12450 [Caldisericales bacterium]|nr:hypothetical protein [Caldisericales bacterium]
MGKMIDPATLSKHGFMRGIFGGSLEAREIDSDNHRITHYISTKTVDSYNTVILPNAFDETRFAKNPVVPWVHDYYSLPVAKSMWRKRDKMGVLAGTEFYPGDFPLEVFRYYELGFLKGWSIGFDWLEYIAYWDEKQREKYEALREKWEIDGFPDVIFTKVDLWEYSACPIPANPDALTKALRDGQIRTLPFRRGLESVGITADRRIFPGAEMDGEGGAAESREAHDGESGGEAGEEHEADPAGAPPADSDSSEEDPAEAGTEQSTDQERTGENEDPNPPLPPGVADGDLPSRQVESLLDRLDNFLDTMSARIENIDTQLRAIETRQAAIENREHQPNNLSALSADQLSAIAADVVRGEIERMRGKIA